MRSYRGQRSEVRDQGSGSSGQWSVVSGQWSVFSYQSSVISHAPRLPPHAPRPTPPAPRLPPHAPRTFTLIELLVVITITLVLMVSAAVMIGPALQNRSVRESARAVNGYLSSARNAAMETGRPCGVIFRCFNATTPCAMTLEQAEVPPTYAGEQTTSSATITWSSGAGAGTVAFYASGAPNRCPLRWST